MAIEVVLKRWGNSIGVVLPKELIDKEKLKENERVLIEVVKEANLSHIFGTLKTGMTGQEFKDMVRKGWKT
ncbi:AbrB/MazE/SpoVT family DNA-binding domain-containing protein [Candidatus Woesearchaeota archaeon]|nr:AbrB/MazE/SpoVT family DNA-binding domain-containing protein [Candidatus Woesearchaeota archaeon]